MSSDPTELDRERAEVERLRVLLVTRDAELGSARGRIKELEARVRIIFGIFGPLRRVRVLVGRLR